MLFPNRSIVEQGLLAAVPQQQQPQHAAALRMLDLAGGNAGGQTGLSPGLPPSGSNGAANGFQSNGLNMNIKDNPSPASESPVPPSKLTPPVGIPFQVHTYINTTQFDQRGSYTKLLRRWS